MRHHRWTRHLNQSNPVGIAQFVGRLTAEVASLDGIVATIEGSPDHVRFLNFSTFREVSRDEVLPRIRRKRAAMIEEIERLNKHLASRIAAAS